MLFLTLYQCSHTKYFLLSVLDSVIILFLFQPQTSADEDASYSPVSEKEKDDPQNGTHIGLTPKSDTQAWGWLRECAEKGFVQWQPSKLQIGVWGFRRRNTLQKIVTISVHNCKAVFVVILWGRVGLKDRIGFLVAGGCLQPQWHTLEETVTGNMQQLQFGTCGKKMGSDRWGVNYISMLWPHILCSPTLELSFAMILLTDVGWYGTRAIKSMNCEFLNIICHSQGVSALILSHFYSKNVQYYFVSFHPKLMLQNTLMGSVELLTFLSDRNESQTILGASFFVKKEMILMLL